MKEITTLEEIRLSKLSDDELIVIAIERAAEQIGTHVRVLKDISRRLSNVEKLVWEIDKELEEYR